MTTLTHWVMTSAGKASREGKQGPAQRRQSCVHLSLLLQAGLGMWILYLRNKLENIFVYPLLREGVGMY